MVKNTEEKKGVNEEKIFKTWADSYTAVHVCSVKGHIKFTPKLYMA
ncbi:MAG: hypothetical protein SCH70_08735 [Candidatus Methanoperedens sp.]|nr:hypothetical protein [Candidatus Methanoperedens sp.]